VTNDLILLNLLIADRTYRIKVAPKDEEVVRKTAKTINDKLLEYKTQFAGKDMQDYLAMVLVWFATEQNAGISQQMQTEHINERLQNLEKLIDITLEKEL
jgi:hypothetical protein